MRITIPTALAAIVAPVFAGAALSGCAPQAADAPTSPVPFEGDERVYDAGLPPDAAPVAEPSAGVECPYLDSQWVAETNGQRVSGVGVDTRFDTPACLFWAGAEAPQLTVVVRHTASTETARAVVDWAAPVGYSDAASLPSGWEGGRAGAGRVPGAAGAVYAVSKGPFAVAVWTDQAESIKAENVTKQVITSLNL